MYIGTSSGTATNIGSASNYGNSGYSISCPSWASTATTTAAGYGYYNDYLKLTNYHQLFNCFIEYLNESELNSIIMTLINRCAPAEDIKNIITDVLNSRHCSEDFIMSFVDYIDLEKIKDKYSSQIKSQEYPRLALLYQSE